LGLVAAAASKEQVLLQQQSAAASEEQLLLQQQQSAARWEEQKRKRVEVMNQLKNMPPYQAFQDMPEEARDKFQIPDPCLRVSKRCWEKQFKTFKLGLNAWFEGAQNLTAKE
jgi:hypothetical protein